jgi:hypothetical protein
MRCIYCESENVVKNGFRINNLTKEKRQEPFCRECKNKSQERKRARKGPFPMGPSFVTHIA